MGLGMRLWLWWKRQDGAATAEYALLLVLVALALITGLTSLGSALNDKIQDIVQTIRQAQPGGGQ
ncbi:MAG: Flp family type IVb pilin [Clostridiales bacterium]|nr:Flp family type IVb pilin [Clostridiales bacterium]